MVGPETNWANHLNWWAQRRTNKKANFLVVQLRVRCLKLCFVRSGFWKSDGWWLRSLDFESLALSSWCARTGPSFAYFRVGSFSSLTADQYALCIVMTDVHVLRIVVESRPCTCCNHVVSKRHMTELSSAPGSWTVIRVCEVSRVFHFVQSMQSWQEDQTSKLRCPVEKKDDDLLGRP